MIQKAYRFRIYPTNNQINFFDNSVRTTRFVYNISLRQQVDISDKMTEMGIIDKDKRNEYMTENKLWFHMFSMSKKLTEMGNTEEFSFLKEVDSTTKSYALRRIDNAFKNMKKTGAGFPKFKNRKSSYSFTGQIQNSCNKVISIKLILDNKKFGYINIPKLKKIKISCHNQFFSENWNNSEIIKLNSYTISKTNDKYFISLQAEVNDPNFNHVSEKKVIEPNTSIGIDFGVTRPITTSDTTNFDNELFSKQFNLIKTSRNEIKKLSSILNKKRDFHKKNSTGIKFYNSHSYQRIRTKLNKLHFKVASKRENIQHNITKKLVDDNNINTFIIEDLSLKNMMKKSGKGKSNKKSNLNRVLGDTGLYSIRQKLEYKAERVGKNVEKVDAKYTSQKCSNCGHISKENRKSQSIFICEKCGHNINADLNAAINIKNKYDFTKNNG